MNSKFLIQVTETLIASRTRERHLQNYVRSPERRVKPECVPLCQKKNDGSEKRL